MASNRITGFTCDQDHDRDCDPNECPAFNYECGYEGCPPHTVAGYVVSLICFGPATLDKFSDGKHAAFSIALCEEHFLYVRRPLGAGGLSDWDPESYPEWVRSWCNEHNTRAVWVTSDVRQGYLVVDYTAAKEP